MQFRNKILTAVLVLFSALQVPTCRAEESLEASFRNQALMVAKQYAESISCDYTIDKNNLIALTPAGQNQDEYSTPEYVLIWYGDDGCYGGAHSIKPLITTINVRAAKTFTVDPMLSSPVIRLPINPKSINKIDRSSSNSLTIVATYFASSEGDCCYEYKEKIRLLRGKNGAWKIGYKKRL